MKRSERPPFTQIKPQTVWLGGPFLNERLVSLLSGSRPHRGAQCADGKVEALTEALQATMASWRGRFPATLNLKLYTSSNFIGLFVDEHVAEVLKSFASEFATEAASKAGALSY